MTTMPSYPLLAPSCRRLRTARRGRGAPAGRRIGGTGKIGPTPSVGWKNPENPIKQGGCASWSTLKGQKGVIKIFQEFLLTPVDRRKRLCDNSDRLGKL